MPQQLRNESQNCSVFGDEIDTIYKENSHGVPGLICKEQWVLVKIDEQPGVLLTKLKIVEWSSAAKH